ncbi:unnamed protein product, partial [Prorocentrum cordatum]
ALMESQQPAVLPTLGAPLAPPPPPPPPVEGAAAPPAAAPAAEGPPVTKRQRSSPGGQGLAPGPAEERPEEDQAFEDEWADTFALMHGGGLEKRAGEYAESLASLKRQMESLKRKRAAAASACSQLLHTAHREALQAHLKALLAAASASAGHGVAAAASETVGRLLPGVPAPSCAGAAGEPGELQPAAVTVSIGIPQPGVTLEPPSQPQALAAAEARAPTPRAPAHGPPPPEASRAAATAAAPAVPQRPAKAAGPKAPAPKAAAPAGAAAAAKPAEANLVYVGGLPEGIDEAMFRALFGRYGGIKSVKLVPAKRLGYVRYGSKKEAKSAIDALNNFEANGVKLVVRHAEAEQKPPGGPQGAPVVVA